MPCRSTLLVPLVAFAVHAAAIFAPVQAFAADSHSVVSGNVRFQALSPELVRMEYSPKAHFTDEASVAVVGRGSFAGIAAATDEKDGWLNVSTEKMTVSYKLSSGPFSHDNLRIRWRDNTGEHSWRPGDKDDSNLGGVPATLDNRSTAAGHRSRPAEPQRLLLSRRQPHRPVRQGHRLGEAPARRGQPGLVLPRLWQRLRRRACGRWRS